MASVFSKIIKGELPSYKIFEDELTFAFLSRGSNNLGHTLIVPKIEVAYFIDLPEPYYSRVFQNAKFIAKAIQNATNCKRVGTIIAGWDVPHFHYHLIPMHNYDDLDVSKAKHFTENEMKEIQKKILKELNKNS